jgi:hypothetical protein
MRHTCPVAASGPTDIEIVRDHLSIEHGGDGWLEFDSLINVRPRQGNRTRSVEDPATREAIVAVVGRLVR